MQQKLILSNRLQQTASYLPKGAVFADIGSDHAYLPCYICLQDASAEAIAGEVNLGPFQSAVSTVDSYGLKEQVQVRLGDGLEVLEQHEVKQVVIAGMGGSLITSILENGKDKLDGVEQLILQPNVDAKSVRDWVVKNGCRISAENIIEENGHIYEIVVADKSGHGIEALSSKEIYFGPFLLKERSTTFLKKWKCEADKISRVITQIKQGNILNHDKIKQFECEHAWIQEVLANDKDCSQ